MEKIECVTRVAKPRRILLESEIVSTSHHSFLPLELILEDATEELA